MFVRWLKRNTGCFVAGTLVWTAAGAVPIEEVPLGALMLTDADAAQHDMLAETDAADRTLHVRMDLAEPDGDRFTLESMVSPDEFAAMSGLASELLGGGPSSVGTVFFADFETEGRPLSVEVLGTSNLLTDGQPRVAMLSKREGITQKVELTVSGFPHPLVTTVEHPFWSEDRSTWVRAGSLTIGEHLRSDVAGAVSIEALSRVYDDRPVYNIEVTQRHNYYVGDAAVLVHNTDCTVDAVFAIDNGPVHYDVNGGQRYEGGLGLRSQGSFHAETGVMHLAFKAGERGGVGELLVDTTRYVEDRICRYCLADIKTMARNLDLEELIVTQIGREGTTQWRFTREMLQTIPNGGASWAEALIP